MSINDTHVETLKHIMRIRDLANKADGKKIKVFHIDKMWGLGTPEDLEAFNKRYES